MITTIMIGNRIAEARKAKNLSQSQLSQQLAVSSQAVGKWERGESMPDIITFNRLAEILGVDLNYFIGNSPLSPTETATAWPTAEPSVVQAVETLPEVPEKKLSWDFSQGNWVDADFSGLKNLGEKFSGSNLQRCLFGGSEMSGLLLKGNNVDGCDFSGSNIGNSRFQSSNIVNNSFRDCSMRETEFSSNHIKGCDFSNADFTGAVFQLGSFLKATTSGAVWNRTTFYAIQFGDVVFDSTINGCSFEACEFSRVTFQNVTLTDTFFKNQNLKKIKFVDCQADKLTYAFLKSGKANMSGITLLTP